jgi:hypothetical protein
MKFIVLNPTDGHPLNVHDALSGDRPFFVLDLVKVLLICFSSTFHEATRVDSCQSRHIHPIH